MSLITLTSGIGCSENTVARILGEKLGLAVFDDQKLQDEALEMGISSEDIKDFDEKAPSLFSRLLTFKPQTYLELTSVLFVRGVVERFCETVGSERVLYGTDLPWFSEHHAIGALLSEDITEDDRHNICHRNAEKLLDGLL